MNQRQILQGGGSVAAPLRQRDVGAQQDGVGEAGRVSYSGGVQDGEATCASARTGSEVDLPKVGGCFLEECGLHTISEYIKVRRDTITAYVVDRSIFCECMDLEQKRGLEPRQWWWEQEMDLDTYDATRLAGV